MLASGGSPQYPSACRQAHTAQQAALSRPGISMQQAAAAGRPVNKLVALVQLGQRLQQQS